MAKNFPVCIPRLISHEGGYVNHPADPGGPTKYGVTIADVRRYVKPGATSADVKALQLDVAENQVYKPKYWDALRCDDLPAGVEDAVFDYGVNSGTGRAAKVLARLVGCNAARVTAEVVAAAGRRDPVTLIRAICAERMAFLRGLRTWPTFGAGWARRVSEVQAYATALAGLPVVADAPSIAPAALPVPLPTAPAPGKGVVPDNAGARTAMSGGVATTGAVVAQQAGAHGANTAAVIILIAISIAAACAAYAFVRWRRDVAQHAIDADVRAVPAQAMAPA